MMSTERKRIAQLRHGQVPKGYQMTRFGIVPSDWMTFRVGDCLERVERSVEVQADKFYTQIGIRSHGKGLFYKEQVAGVELGKKAVFWIEPDCFILNIVFAWEQAIGKTTQAEVGMIGSHRFPMYRPVKDRVDIDYLISFFLTKRGTDILEAASPGGAGRNKTLGQDRFLKSKIVLPPLPEQRKIAAILATQDKVIELYERKIEQLQLLKKNCLRKMFPRHGNDTPEVRFRGFTGTWERKRLGDLFTEYAEKGRPELPALMTIQGGGTVLRDESDRKLQYDKHSLSNYKVANKGDFIVHLRSFEGGLEIVTTPGLISPAYHVFHGKRINPRFYYAYFRSVDFIECDLKPHVYGIRDGRSIDIEGMKTIMIPHVSLKEQQAIGNCIESFDRLIALNQRKRDEEKQKKKALMQLLLTGIVRVGKAASCRLERAGNEAAGSRFSTRIAKV
mgnify:CR=1 FL=1